jgi:hypothetical protein
VVTDKHGRIIANLTPKLVNCGWDEGIKKIAEAMSAIAKELPSSKAHRRGHHKFITAGVLLGNGLTVCISSFSNCCHTH